jgi:bifunctional non-homologous end joining protein LigD
MARSAALKVPPVRRMAADATPAAGAVRGILPASQAPQLAALADRVPEGAEWISELKLDGYRLLVWIDHGRARLVTRNGHDWTPRMPCLTARFAAIGAETALLDGEMVALGPDV